MPGNLIGNHNYYLSKSEYVSMNYSKNIDSNNGKGGGMESKDDNVFNLKTLEEPRNSAIFKNNGNGSNVKKFGVAIDVLLDEQNLHGVSKGLKNLLSSYTME